MRAEYLVFGDWDNCTVRLDFDDTPLGEVKLWAFKALMFFKLGGFRIDQSSENVYTVTDDQDREVYKYVKSSYLVVFDRRVSWTVNVHVMNWVALESRNEDLRRYVRMQCIKETSTIRSSNKLEKPPPKFAFRFGSQDGQIEKFLEVRKFIRDHVDVREIEPLELPSWITD